jgi:hypothetical protein
MKRTAKLLAVVAALAFVAVIPAQATILFQSLGTNAPPATLGGLPMTPFVQQPGPPTYADVTTIPGCPIPGSMTASPAVNWRQIGNGWASWSHGYTGDVYWSNGATSVTFTMPPGTTAFYLYVEPNPFAVWDITAVSDSGVSSGAIPVNGGAGASGFAFYTDAADNILTITVSSGVDFAVGEFGISTATNFNLSFYDDISGAAQFCVSNQSGNYEWDNYDAYQTYTGRAEVVNGGAAVWNGPTDPNFLYVVYNPVQFNAYGYFYDTELGIFSSLVDHDTRDTPFPCGGGFDDAVKR